MSKKNLLNESQVRQFMKLARLEPLTPGFIHGLQEKQGAVDKEDEHLGAKDGPERDKKQSMKDRRKEMRGEDRAEGDDAAAVEENKAYTAKKEKPGADKRKGAEKRGAEGTLAKTKGHGEVDYVDESHGRGRGESAAGYGSVDNNNDRAGARLREAEAGPGELEDYAEDDLEDDSLEGDEEAADDELEAAEEEGDLDMDAGEGRMVAVDDFLAALETALEDVMGDEVEVDTSEMEDEELEGEELEADVELPMGGEEVEMDVEEELEERLREAAWKGPSVNDPDRIAYDKSSRKAAPTTAKQKPRVKASQVGGSRDRLKGTYKPVVQETDALVEQITKRVAARILKSALAKK